MPNVFKGTANQIESNLNKVQEIHDYDDKIESYPSVGCMTQYVDFKTNKTTPKAVVAFLGGPFEYDDPDMPELGGVGYGSCTVVHDENTCVVVGAPHETTSNPVLFKYLSDNNISKIDMLCIPGYSGHQFVQPVYTRLQRHGYIDKDTYVVVPHSNLDNVAIDVPSTMMTYDHYIKPDSEEGAITLKSPIGDDSNPSEYVCGNIKVKCYNVNITHLQSYKSPSNDRWVDYGEMSMVNLIEVAGCKILTTGDVKEQAIRRMWENNGVLSRKDIDIMTVPYYGGNVGELPNHIINNIWAKHGVIQYCTGNDLILKEATSFTKTLLNNGCKVNTTYGKDNVIRNVIYHLNDGNITPVQTGLPAGNMIPYELSDGKTTTECTVYITDLENNRASTPIDVYTSKEYLTNEMFNNRPVFTKLYKYVVEDGVPSNWEILYLPTNISNLHWCVELDAHVWTPTSNGDSFCLVQKGVEPIPEDSAIWMASFGDVMWGFNNTEYEPGTSLYIKLKYTKKD